MDLSYIKETGESIRDEMGNFHPIAVVYEPGNMTRYNLTFTPLDAFTYLGEKNPFDGSDFYYVLVTLLNRQSAYPFRIHPSTKERIASDYIAEKLSCTLGDGDALSLLFQVIAGYEGAADKSADGA